MTLLLTLKDYVAPEVPIPLNRPPPLGTVEASGMAAVDVVNNVSYTLTLEFGG